MNKSPLMARMHRDLGGLRPPRAVPVVLRTKTELPRVTPCTVLKEATGFGRCKTVDCRSCAHLTAVLPENAHWLCSACSRPYKTLGYYGDGRCDGCGANSIVLALSDHVPL